MSDFPTAIHNPTSPTLNDTLATVPHATQHQNHNAEIVAIETKIGTGSSTPASNTFLVGTGSGTSAWQSLTSAQLAARLTDETGSGAAVFATSPTIVTPTIASLTNMQHDHTNAAGGGALVSPKITTSIVDTNGNEEIKFVATTSAVNEITFRNAATGNAPRIEASGDNTNIDLNLRGKGTGQVTIGPGATKIFPFNFIVSGCVWSADAAGSTLLGSMTSGVVVINGKSLTVAAVSNHAFTASKDTYVDFQDNGDGTALIIYTEATNNAASPALPNSKTETDNIRNAIVVTGATSIAASTSINQGEPGDLLPIASTQPYEFTDSLGNIINPRDPVRRLLGYRRITGDVNPVGGFALGLASPVIVPANRNISVRGWASNIQTTSGAATALNIAINEGATQLANQPITNAGANYGNPAQVEAGLIRPTAGLHTYKIAFGGSSGTILMAANVLTPAFIKVTLE